MTITEVFQKITSGEMAGWALMALILLLSLIQISPLNVERRILSGAGDTVFEDIAA